MSELSSQYEVYKVSVIGPPTRILYSGVYWGSSAVCSDGSALGVSNEEEVVGSGVAGSLVLSGESWLPAEGETSLAGAGSGVGVTSAISFSLLERFQKYRTGALRQCCDAGREE